MHLSMMGIAFLLIRILTHVTTRFPVAAWRITWRKVMTHENESLPVYAAEATLTELKIVVGTPNHTQYFTRPDR